VCSNSPPRSRAGHLCLPPTSVGEATPDYRVDHPASQVFKRDRPWAGWCRHPYQCHLLSIDFERTTLQEGLGAVAFDPQIPTFFAWLGVTQYLTSRGH